MLAVRSHGPWPHVIALHGFTHTATQFDDLAGCLGRALVALDLPGHGGSTDLPTDANSAVDAVADTIESLGGPAPVLGYSQGARVALSVAIDRPETVTSLVLVSGTAGIADDDERTRRCETDAALADHIRTVGVPVFVDEWTSTGITSTMHRDSATRHADRIRRTANTADGLARALVGYGQGAMPPRWDELASLALPTLIISGADDERYTTIASSMADAIPDAELRIVEGVSHDAIGDRPDEVARLVSVFLDGLS